jgi:hypothetical protein
LNRATRKSTKHRSVDVGENRFAAFVEEFSDCGEAPAPRRAAEQSRAEPFLGFLHMLGSHRRGDIGFTRLFKSEARRHNFMQDLEYLQ